MRTIASSSLAVCNRVDSVQQFLMSDDRFLFPLALCRVKRHKFITLKILNPRRTHPRPTYAKPLRESFDLMRVEYVPVGQSHENEFQKYIPVFKCIPCRLQVTFQDGKSCVQARAGERGQRKRRRMQRR